MLMNTGSSRTVWMAYRIERPVWIYNRAASERLPDMDDIPDMDDDEAGLASGGVEEVEDLATACWSNRRVSTTHG